MPIDFIIGRKVGMTRIFDDLGSDYPVTIVEAGPCEITQIKSINNEEHCIIVSLFSCVSSILVSSNSKI